MRPLLSSRVPRLRARVQLSTGPLSLLSLHLFLHLPKLFLLKLLLLLPCLLLWALARLRLLWRRRRSRWTRRRRRQWPLGKAQASLATFASGPSGCLSIAKVTLARRGESARLVFSAPNTGLVKRHLE